MPAELSFAVLYGFLTALAFALWPLGRAHDVPVSALYRDAVAPERRYPRPRYIVLTAAGGRAARRAGGRCSPMTARSPRSSSRRRPPCSSRCASSPLLIMAAARRVPRPRYALLRLVLANIHRPGRADAERRALARPRPRAAGHAAADRRQSAPPVRRRAARQGAVGILRRHPGRRRGALRRLRQAARRRDARYERVPMLRGRIVSAHGVRAEDLKAPPNAAWVLQSDRGITYADDVPAGSRVVAGEWWKPDYQGPPLVSFENKIAEGLGLKIGDPVVVNVLGRNITATLANTARGRLAVARHQFRAGVLARQLPRRAAHPHRDLHLPGRRDHRAGDRPAARRPRPNSRPRPRCACARRSMRSPRWCST